MADFTPTGDYYVYPTYGTNQSGIEGAGANQKSYRNDEVIMEKIMSAVIGMSYVVSGFVTPASSANLNITIPLGEAMISGRYVSYPNAVQITVTANQTSYAFLKLEKDANGYVVGTAIEVNTTGTAPDDSVALSVLISDATQITETRDARPLTAKRGRQNRMIVYPGTEGGVFDGGGFIIDEYAYFAPSAEKHTAWIIGGGGAGGLGQLYGGNSGGGGGGGSANFTIAELELTPGQVEEVTIGHGGHYYLSLGSYSHTPATPSSVAGISSAIGSPGANGGAGTGGTGGAGAAAAVASGYYKIEGFDGVDAETPGGSGGNGGAGTDGTGLRGFKGGVGGTKQASPADVTLAAGGTGAYGAGGGGGGGYSGGSGAGNGTRGGNGGAGLVAIFY